MPTIESKETAALCSAEPTYFLKFLKFSIFGDIFPYWGAKCRLLQDCEFIFRLRANCWKRDHRTTEAGIDRRLKSQRPTTSIECWNPHSEAAPNVPDSTAMKTPANPWFKVFQPLVSKVNMKQMPGPARMSADCPFISITWKQPEQIKDRLWIHLRIQERSKNSLRPHISNNLRYNISQGYITEGKKFLPDKYTRTRLRSSLFFVAHQMIPSGTPETLVGYFLGEQIV